MTISNGARRAAERLCESDGIMETPEEIAQFIERETRAAELAEALTELIYAHSSEVVEHPTMDRARRLLMEVRR